MEEVTVKTSKRNRDRMAKTAFEVEITKQISSRVFEPTDLQ